MDSRLGADAWHGLAGTSAEDKRDMHISARPPLLSASVSAEVHSVEDEAEVEIGLNEYAWSSASFSHDYIYFHTNKSSFELGHDMQT